MRGKHQKKIPLVKRLTVAIFFAGIVMLITAFVLEARYYPWGKLFGTASQSEDSIPDPTPPSIIISTLGPVTSTPARATPSANAPVESIEPEVTEEVEEIPQLDQLGILKIPVINVSQNLYLGAGMDEMKYGVGHVTGTSMPGEKGNCAISGHRPYPFRYLDTLAEDDNVIIKSNDIVYTYKVYESFEVLPEETWVLDSVEGEKYTLTLITCTPYMVSSHRLIVRARLSDINGMSPSMYYYGEEEEEPPETNGNEGGDEEGEGTEEPEGAEEPEATPGQTNNENKQSDFETEEPAGTDAHRETDIPQDTEGPEETDASHETEEPRETDAPQDTEEPRETDVPQGTTEASQETDAPQQSEAIDETEIPTLTA